MNAREYWTVLREDRWLVGGIVAVCVVIAAAVAALLPRTYTSTAVFYVASPQTTTSSSDSYQGAQLSTERVKSYSELITGPRVAADASALLGGSPTAEEIQGSVSADAVAETVVLNVGVTQPTPQEAQLVGQAVTTSFTRLVNSIESTGQPVNRPIVSTEVIFPPTVPIYPAGPGTTMLLAAGLLAGVVLGTGVALGRRAMRRAVDSADTLAEGLDTTVLAAMPALPRRPDRPALLAEPAPGRRGRSAARARDRAAAVRRLRTAVLAGAGSRRCLVVTGVRSEQGTTTVAVDLAVALALAGESVVLVDADLRRPAVAGRLDLPEQPGLADALGARRASGGVVGVQRSTVGGFDVLTSGSAVERPGEVWGSPAGAAVLTGLRETYGWVLLDASPLSGSPDALDLAALADGVVVVARRGSARPEDLDVAAAGLRTVGAPAVGAVLTFAVDVPESPLETRRALPPGRPAAVTPAPAPAAAPAAPAAPAENEPEPELVAVAEPVPEAEPAAVAEPMVAEPEPEALSAEPEPAAVVEPETATEPQPEPVVPEPATPARAGDEPATTAPEPTPVVPEPAASSDEAAAAETPKRRGRRRATSSWSVPATTPAGPADPPPAEPPTNGHHPTRTNGAVNGNATGAVARRRRRVVRPAPTTTSS
ncbi:Wzz/FepE/Etk N-terminal domain-containing protein [Actinomycetospora atypica]|uniref:Wzz/FepE/Etk N-terminal domain-containing protein n=1 Tax=Actinomycetospora atypica TaxID=1290095 RepID=A0ABV9YFZ1_9PSEU